MLVVTSANTRLSRAIIAAEAIKAHKDDPPAVLAHDVVVNAKGPNTERAVEALLLKNKGPYPRQAIEELINFLKDSTKYPINTSIRGKENAQLLGLIAIDLAKYHSHTPSLKETIVKRLKELEMFDYFINDTPPNNPLDPGSYYLNQFIAALYSINPREATPYMRQYNIEQKELEAIIKI